MRAFLGLGSNVGKREDYLAEAVRALSSLEGIRIIGVSAVYETDPWGKADQRRFLNQALLLETSFSPRGLLRECRQIEDSLDREREERWSARTIDIDIHLLDDLILCDQDLQVPHPLLTKRKFALVPLAEIAYEEQIPGSGMTVGEALEHCPDSGRVVFYTHAGIP